MPVPGGPDGTDGRNSRVFRQIGITYNFFLSFSPALDFMEHGIKPLRPSAPDLTISSVDNTCSVPRELADELREDPAVKRVYGRSSAYAVPARAGQEEFQIDLNSYEENQFRWAEDSVAEGSIEDAEEGGGVF